MRKPESRMIVIIAITELNHLSLVVLIRKRWMIKWSCPICRSVCKFWEYENKTRWPHGTDVSAEPSNSTGSTVKGIRTQLGSRYFHDSSAGAGQEVLLGVAPLISNTNDSFHHRIHTSFMFSSAPKEKTLGSMRFGKIIFCIIHWRLL